VSNLVSIPFIQKIVLTGNSSVEKGDYEDADNQGDDKHKLTWDIESKGIITAKGSALHSAIASQLIKYVQ